MPAPAHLIPIQRARTLTSELRPVGSVNLQALAKQGGVPERQLREGELEGRHAVHISTKPWVHLVEAEPIFDGLCQKHQPLLPHVCRFIAATGELTYIRVNRIDPRKVRSGTAAPAFMVDTEAGVMLLRDETYIVWA